MVSNLDNQGVINFGGKHWSGTWNQYNGTYPNQFLELLRHADNQWWKLQKSLYSIPGKMFWLYFYQGIIQFVFAMVYQSSESSKVWRPMAIVGIYFPSNENTKSKEGCYKHFALDFLFAQYTNLLIRRALKKIEKWC